MNKEVITAPSIAQLPYLPPLGLPLSWRDEQSGTLPTIVMHYHDRPSIPLSPDHWRALIAYLRYWIQAPCWRDSGDGLVTLVELRREIDQVQTVADLDRWIGRCLELGIDPL